MKEKLALTDKWIVVDLDGTILHNDRVPPKVSRSAQMLQASGWSLIVATGRILAGALPHIKSLKTWCPAIVYDGARVMGPKAKEVYFERKIQMCIRDRRQGRNNRRAYRSRAGGI